MLRLKLIIMFNLRTSNKINKSQPDGNISLPCNLVRQTVKFTQTAAATSKTKINQMK